MKKYFKFPTGEVHCKLDGGGEHNLSVPMTSNLSDYFMTVLMAIDANYRILHQPFNLFLPYLPYSRQDRPTSYGEPFSLKVIGNILNQLPLEKIYTLDVHSDVAFGCINNLVNIAPQQIWLEGEGDDFIADKSYPLEQFTLVIPDQGAYKKLSQFPLEKFAGVVTCIKERNISNGHLEIKYINGDFHNKRCLIIDDICDAGGTFIRLTEKLLVEAQSVSLAVTHGIFTRGLDPLFEAGISKIFTTDSFPQDSHGAAAASGTLVVKSLAEGRFYGN